LKNRSKIIGYAFLATSLLLYGLKRYNGWDLETYFQAAEAAARGEHLYGKEPLTLYPPPGGYCLEILSYFPPKLIHLLWYLVSVLLFLRICWIGYFLFPLQTSSKVRRNVFYVVSIWAILQGIGAQLESGNINLLLKYFLIEGVYLILKTKPATLIGLFLLWLPVIFKPYLGLISLGTTIATAKKFGLRAWLAPLSLFFLSLMLPLIFKGYDWFVFDIQQWLLQDVDHVHRAFTLSFNAVNFGLPSYFYHIYGLPLQAITTVTLLVSGLAILYSFQEQDLLKLFCVLCTLTFCISPASFSYSMLLLWFPILHFARLLVSEGKNEGFSFQKTARILFLLALIFLNPTFTGRDFFNQVIVPHRVTTWFVVLAFFAIWRGFGNTQKVP